MNKQLILLFLICFFFSSVCSARETETAFERVIRTGTLRCGYNFWEPGLMTDEKTNTLWGFYFDVMKEFEKESGVRVVWDHVVDWGLVQEDLKSKKIDAMCAMWNTTAESRYFLFTHPFAYQGVEAIVRADDQRFDQDIMEANDPGVTIAIVDNATQDFIARSDFPLAKRFGSPLFGSNAELMMAIQSKKADMTFTNPGIFNGYNLHNPGQLKRLKPGLNLRLYGNSLAVDLKEKDLATLLNVSFSHLIDTGKIKELIERYNKNYPDTFYIPRSGYLTR